MKAALLALWATTALAADVDAGALAQPHSVNARARPNKVQLGEPFEYEIVINHDKGQRYELRAPATLEDFELVNQTRAREDGPDAATTTFRLKLSGFALGEKTLPTLVFDVYDGERSGTLPVAGADVEVVGTLSPEAEQNGAQLYGLKPLEEVAVRSYRLLYLIAGLLALGALAYGIYRFAKRPRPVPAAPVAPPQPLHVRTREALDVLRSEDLPAQGRVREFYFRLSEILRGYLGERFSFEALESTSTELIEMLQKLHTPGLKLQEFVSFINESDLAKFAKAPLGPTECHGALEYAYRLVNDTTNASQPRVP